MLRSLLILLCTHHLFAFTQETRINLTDWYFNDSEKTLSSERILKANVPGVVHLDLMNNFGASWDFYNYDQEHSEFSIWIENTDWMYETTFEISENDLNQNTELVFEGLDTYADVYLNDSLVLKADNMFRTWVIPVNDLLKIGTNYLSVHFTSPLNYNREKVKNAKYELPSGNETVDLKVSAYTRKAAYQFGWDFGPRFVTCGIWRPCYLRLCNEVRLSDFNATTQLINEHGARVWFEFWFDINSKQSLTEVFIFEFLSESLNCKFDNGKNFIRFPITIRNPKMWYPNGCGEQNLYHESFMLKNSEGVIVLKDSVTFGIRTIELINGPDSIGTSFFFKVNNKPIFIKGANYVPQDLFLPRVTEEQTLRLLTQVKEANMNMIRVWGGGIYESDYFYSTCDSLGIMVWQDFMFANSMYPKDSAFHETVAQEIEDNVMRLRNHPCIALWCGNNEIEVAWHNWGWQKQFGYSQKDSTEIWKNYLSIFHDLIPTKLKELDPSRTYIPSSPQSNWGTKENFNHGAMHYWGVWHGKEDLDSFKTNVGRFMVEYGFQSYPLEDWLEQTIEYHINPDDSIFKNRQKSYIGDVLIKKEIQNYFGVPIAIGKESFSDWLWASQFIQSQALKTAIQSHRLAAPHCMGTLFWQLNDCWPGASWSVIDYYGNEKIAYQEIKNQFSPTIAVVDTLNNELSVTVISDKSFTGILILNVESSFGFESLKKANLKFEVNAGEPKKIWSMKLSKYYKMYPFPFFDLMITILREDGDSIAFEDYFYFRKMKIDEIY